MLLDVFVKELLLMPWDDVPSLGLSVVVVVDRVQEEILDMPAKGGELHAHIHPWLGNTTNLLLFLVNYPQQGRGRFVEVVEVKEVALVLKISVQPIVDLPRREATPIERRWQVCSVFHSHAVVPICISKGLH